MKGELRVANLNDLCEGEVLASVASSQVNITVPCYHETPCMDGLME